MIILDTNVVSEFMRVDADDGVIAWLDQQVPSDVYLSAVTAAELRYGVARLPAGRRKANLAERLRRAIEVKFADRILPFDDDAAILYPEVLLGRERQGLIINVPDAQIAAICRSNSADLATRNTKDFTHTGIKLIDPWRAPRGRAPAG